ncbi:MAG: hypothetical protein MRECE_12c003 [Mycoplasmataceae bacterium CE_OT135]|nr:MAG: hypothetical protein MRECE_12c003 [Mycoplasmataceae bacterium CE_OT135]
MQRIVKCDKCKKQFIQKWVGPRKQWSQINQVSYWTSGKRWKNYKLLCRPCLKFWFEAEREIFDKLVDSESKQRMFFSYRGHGALDKPDHPTK